jgi:hypothetical protein
MNLHQRLKSIETKRGRELRHPASKIVDKWESPIQGQVTKRRKLSLRPEEIKEVPVSRRGPLEIGLINRNGGSDSIVQRSISLQMQHFEKILDSRISKIKTELLEK